jgi:hypothetical protein
MKRLPSVAPDNFRVGCIPATATLGLSQIRDGRVSFSRSRRGDVPRLQFFGGIRCQRWADISKFKLHFLQRLASALPDSWRISCLTYSAVVNC